ncbi:MAG: antitoxin HicB [Muribaculaceae bacterium]|nr:antitoxin HicB [Muribaculaceae bacterium]
MEKKLIINICASEDSFGAYAKNCSGINIAGDSVKDIKEQVPKVIELYKEVNPESEWEDPIRENWSIEWKYDVQSILNYYSGIISNAALERLTGINQKQLWNYAHGVKKPRQAAKEKIESALHKLGQELIEFSF